MQVVLAMDGVGIHGLWLQAHDAPVRTMKWAHDGTWMVTGDHGGYIKYWQSNMNNVKMFQVC